MTIPPEDLNLIRNAAYDGAKAGVADALQGAPKADAKVVFGPLNEYGAHQIYGFGVAGMWYFTLMGWDNATTDQQRANLASQVGIDLDTGELAPTGPAPAGFAEGRISNPFVVPLFERGKPDKAGNVPWVKIDESAGRKFERLRVRSRDATEIINAAVLLQNRTVSASHP